MRIHSVLVPGMADEIGVQVQSDGTALNLWEDGTAGVPEDVREMAEELFDPESHPVISEGDSPSYNPGKPGRTWDEQFKPDASVPRFYADVTDTITLVVEYDDGWHLWRIDKLKGHEIASGHQHLVGPLESFLDVQDAAVVAFDRIADEQAESGPEATVHQTFNIGEDDDADTLVMYGVPRHTLNDPAALREALLQAHVENDRLKTVVMKLYPFARTRVEELEAVRTAAAKDSEDGKRSGKSREQLRRNVLGFDAKLSRWQAACRAIVTMGLPVRDQE